MNNINVTKRYLDLPWNFESRPFEYRRKYLTDLKQILEKKLEEVPIKYSLEIDCFNRQTTPFMQKHLERMLEVLERDWDIMLK